MRTISLHRRNIHKGRLIVINQNYPLLREEKEQQNAMVPVFVRNPEVLLEYKTAAVLSHLIDTLGCEEEIIPVSGYRTFVEQSKIYNESVLENGIDFTKKYVALPNHSEHQSGMAIDLALKQDKIDFIRPHFPYDGICSRFREKAPLYGFVERYQSGKENITGIAHEPWHFRYVGYPHSILMKQMNLALEEYVTFIKDFPYEGKHFITQVFGQKVEIFYVNCDTNLAFIELEEDIIYQCSGNNMDGFILTVWR